MENNDFEIQDSNAAKKLKALGLDMNEKIHSEEDEIKKGNFWDNIWYRYKWVIIIGSALLVIAVILIAQIVAKKDDDVRIAYAGPSYIADTETRNSLANIFSSIAKDYNEDGELIINISSSVILNSAQLKEEDEEGRKPNASQIGQNQELLNTFNMQMGSGNSIIYFLDPLLYQESLKSGIVMNMEEELNIDIPDELKFDENAIYLKKTEFGSYYKGLDKLPNDTIIIMVKTYSVEDEDYQNSIDFLKALISFKAPQQ